MITSKALPLHLANDPLRPNAYGAISGSAENPREGGAAEQRPTRAYVARHRYRHGAHLLPHRTGEESCFYAQLATNQPIESGFSRRVVTVKKRHSVGDRVHDLRRLISETRPGHPGVGGYR